MSFSTNFLPSSQVISNITRANPAVVTTVANHGYFNGIYVRVNLPLANGMQEINGGFFLATILSSNSFSINVDTSNFNSFIPGTSPQVPQVIPVGETANTLKNAEINAKNIIPET